MISRATFCPDGVPAYEDKTYLVVDYSKRKNGNAFSMSQIKCLGRFATEEDAIVYAKQLPARKRKNVGIEIWGIDGSGHPVDFLDSAMVATL